MEHYGRLSRKDRRKALWPMVGLMALGVIVIFLTAIWGFHGRKDKKPISVMQPTLKVNLPALSDSLIQECIHSFGLNDSLFVDSLGHQASGNPGVSFRWYRQSWPEGLPFIIFVQRLNGMAVENHIQCDCEEFSNVGKLDCSLRSGGSIGARIIFQADKQTKLANREIAIILTNSGTYEEPEIKDMVYNGMIFNYLATLDIYPTQSILKLLQRGGISAMLNLPATAQGWIDLGGKKRSRQFRFDESQVEGAFSQHPGTKAIYFDLTQGIDLEVVRSILIMAHSKRIAYFSPNYSSNGIDSLAFSLGLPVIRMKIEPDLKGMALSEMRIGLLNRLLGNPADRPKIICIDASATKPGDLIALKLMFDKIGVKLRPFMKLAEPVKSL
jgi:hypothetical protein